MNSRACLNCTTVGAIKAFGLCRKCYKADWQRKNQDKVEAHNEAHEAKYKAANEFEALLRSASLDAQRLIYKLEAPIRAQAYYQSHKKQYNKAATIRLRNWRKENPELAKERYRIADARKMQTEAGRTKRKEFDKRKHQQRYTENPAAFKFRASIRRAARIQATPKWLSKEQRQEIYQIYANCPKGYHVDHIVPLRGKNVSGLHVPWNLRIIPAAENLSKGNKLIEELVNKKVG